MASPKYQKVDKKQCFGCGQVKPIQAFFSDAAHRMTARCEECRALRRKYSREERSIKLAGLSRFSNHYCIFCRNLAVLGEMACPEHMDTIVDNARNKDADAVKIYEYQYNCTFCSWQKFVGYTRDKANLIRRAGSYKCPNCNGLLELTDTGNIVGKIYDDLQNSA